MVIVTSYGLAVVMCIVTMLCWGSWANTQKLASKEWRFQLFYWDYAIGVLLLSLLMAFTLGSSGDAGRGFTEDLAQASGSSIGLALLGGAVFNLGNLLLVAAIDIAGMAVAFPVAVGLALSIGVINNYVADPTGNPYILFLGVALVVCAVILTAVAYGRLPSAGGKTPLKGIVVALCAGVLMGFFYLFVAGSMAAPAEFGSMPAGKMGPYAAVFVFAVGLLASNFVWNSLFMAKPLVGEPVRFSDYLTQGTPRLHLIGVLGGAIWCVGMSFSIIAAGAAGFAISYGLGQGATLVAAIWGVFIWKEFNKAPAGTGKYLAVMFLCYVAGLVAIVLSRFV